MLLFCFLLLFFCDGVVKLPYRCCQEREMRALPTAIELPALHGQTEHLETGSHRVLEQVLVSVPLLGHEDVGSGHLLQDAAPPL